MALGVSTATLWVRAVNPTVPGRYPSCPFLLLSGFYCPGCGGLRAVHHLAHGDLAGAWDLNPLVTLSIPVAVALWVGWLVATLRGRPPWTPSTRMVSGLAIVVVAFWVLRNIPLFAPYLAP